MKRILLALAAIALSASPALAVERVGLIHTTPSVVPHPLPQGVPYFQSGGPYHEPIMLRFGIVDGRRVLVDAISGTIVYRLQP